MLLGVVAAAVALLAAAQLAAGLLAAAGPTAQLLIERLAQVDGYSVIVGPEMDSKYTYAASVSIFASSPQGKL
jgi:hypothetical protein